MLVRRISCYVIAITLSLPIQAQVSFGEVTSLDHFGGPSSGVYSPTLEESQRIAWFRGAKYGMFIHWGLYSQMAGYWKGTKVTGGEWAIKMHKLPIEEYRALAEAFNPQKFNADEWVSLIKKAGMKYVVITSKHHDGFAMYHSSVSTYNIVDATPFRRDPIMELKDACKRQGIRFGLYYSHAQDWNEPDGYGNNWSWPGYDRDMNKYLDQKSLPQIQELCERYKPDIIWFDTAGEITPERADQIVKLCRSIVPQVLINSRLLIGKPKGKNLTDYDGSGDNEAFPIYHQVPWELCGTLNKSWAYKKWDTAFRPVKELLFNLIDAVSKNGNYLLNVGPTADGEILSPYSTRLIEIGKWLKINGEAVYGCSGTAFGDEYGKFSLEDGKKTFIPNPVVWRSTTKPGKVFIHIFNWPLDGMINLPPMNQQIRKVRFLHSRRSHLNFSQQENGITLHLPNKTPDPVLSVIELSY